MANLMRLALIPLVYMAVSHVLHLLYFGGTFCDSKASLKGRTVIVTGANTGIGRATAMDMAARGARVILACRSERRTLPALEEIRAKTGNEEVIFMQLDLGSFASVNQFSEQFLRTEKRLDILINNAGMIGKEEPQLSVDGIELTLAVNHLGPFLLTQNLLELLIKSGPGSRIVNVASLMHHFANPSAFQDLDGSLARDGFPGIPQDFFLHQKPPRPNFVMDNLIPTVVKQKMYDSFLSAPQIIRYGNSKLANVLFTKELAKRLDGKGVTAYSLHPGVIRTEIGMDRSSGQAMDSWSRIVDAIPKFLNPFLFLFKTLEGGAQTTVCCAVSEKHALESGLYYSDCEVSPVTREEMNDQYAAQFYDWSAGVIEKALS